MRLSIFLLMFFPSILIAQGQVRTANNGNLVMQGIPEVPAELKKRLDRYQNVRSANFAAWSGDGSAIYIRTRFGNVSQLHEVSMPMGARKQLTFFEEPLGTVTRQPGSQRMTFTMDAGGNEFSQIFLLDPSTGESRMLTDGGSRNGSVIWDKAGKRIAYLSTERNGRSNDVWIMNVDEPESRRVVFQAKDGTYWFPEEFDESGNRLILGNYVSIVNSGFHLLDLNTGESRQLRGSADNPSANQAAGFDSAGDGIFLLTDEGTEFIQLAYQSLAEPAPITRITSDIDWDLTEVALGDNRKHGAFTVNAGGIDELYLLDPVTFNYRRVGGLPEGLIGNLDFSPDGRKLALTLNSHDTPSDVFVLSLGPGALEYARPTRWTESEVGGLDTDSFIGPQLISYRSFDGRDIPAFYFKPAGEGPHPVVISIHGGPESQARPRFSSTYQMWLAELGLAVLVPNVRGSSGYGRTYVQLDNGFRREDSVKDIGALLDWIQQQPELDASKVAVYGGSYGGYMVLASAVHYSERLAAAVDIVGISNFVTFLENTQAYRRDARRQEYGDERDPAMRAHLERISPLNHVDKIAIPMLVVQGENDPRVPVTESTQLVDAMRANGQPVWYMNALNEGHGYARKENRDIYRQVAAMFLQRYLTR